MSLWNLFGGDRKPVADSALDADLRAAEQWLRASNCENGRQWALGEERKFEVDQDQRRMSLAFRDQKRAVVPVQIIASFVPQTRSTKWAWANESVDPPLAEAAAALKRYGEDHRVPALVDPEPVLTFAELTGFAALAASRFGCRGLYRCIRHDHSTVMVGFGSAELQSKDGRPLAMEKLWPKGMSGEAFEADARALVEAWDAEMLPIDRAFHGVGDPTDPEVMDAALDAKDAVYARYWRPRNELWRPNSFSWPSEHEPEGSLPTVTLPRRGGGCFVVRMPGSDILAYVVEAFGAEPRITDIDLNWGRGLVWIDRRS